MVSSKSLCTIFPENDWRLEASTTCNNMGNRSKTGLPTMPPVPFYLSLHSSSIRGLTIFLGSLLQRRGENRFGCGYLDIDSRRLSSDPSTWSVVSASLFVQFVVNLHSMHNRGGLVPRLSSTCTQEAWERSTNMISGAAITPGSGNE